MSEKLCFWKIIIQDKYKIEKLQLTQQHKLENSSGKQLYTYWLQ